MSVLRGTYVFVPCMGGKISRQVMDSPLVRGLQGTEGYFHHRTLPGLSRRYSGTSRYSRTEMFMEFKAGDCQDATAAHQHVRR